MEEGGDGREVDEKVSSSFPSMAVLDDFFEVSFDPSFTGSLEREGEAMVGGSSARLDSRVGSDGGEGATGSKTRREMSNELRVCAGSS